MSIDIQKLVAALKRKREAEGLSIRKLSAVIGVSFSTLARIERRDGEPDNNSILRILEWLGVEGRNSGLTFENVAFVHFRAAKNANSRTIQCLLQAADILKRKYDVQTYVPLPSESGDSTSSEMQSRAMALSKPEMEKMARQFRKELGLMDSSPLEALAISIEGVDVFVPTQISELSEKCLRHLTKTGSQEWSAMSVPLDFDGNRWAILRNVQHSVERQRVTYLEECWHILLGHKLTKIARVAEAYGRTFESSEEHDAFYLASASLLPDKAVINCVNNGKLSAHIGEQFGVSPELVEYRIKRLGLWRKFKGLEVRLSTDAG
jgi:transcriptional regulator with XRE-family HTH domain